MTNLTKTQQDYLQRLADGALQKNIAQDCNVSLSKVKRILTEIYNILSANGKAHAVAIAFRNGWVK